MKPDSDTGGVVAFRPIGHVESPHRAPAETPIQPRFATGCVGRAVILPEYAEGLRDIEGFSHVFLLYHLHRVDTVKLTVTPFLEDRQHGVFATRHPCRPNPIGLSVLPLIERVDNVLVLGDIDVLDGTPILDIKPYLGLFDRPDGVRDGWVVAVNKDGMEARGRRERPTDDRPR